MKSIIAFLMLAGLMLAGLTPTSAYSNIGSDFFAGLPDNSWVRVPTLNNPRHDEHGGIAIDNERGFLYLFGSDTHNDKTPDNSIHTLNLSTLQWTQSYTPDPLSTYIQQDDGLTITSNGNPWAMHAFSNLVFLPERNALLLHGTPGHNYTGIAAAGAQNLGMQNWLYFPKDNQWQALKNSDSPRLYAQGISYNPDLNRVIGYDNSSSHRETYLFNPQSLTWDTTASTGAHSSGIEAGAGFNPVSGKSFRFAGNGPKSKKLTEYDPVKSIWAEVPTTGELPPFGAGPSIAVDTVNNVLIYHSVDHDDNYRTNKKGFSNTWVLDLKTHHWTKMAPSPRPPNYAFTFTMTFYEKQNVALYYSMVAEPGKPNWSGSPELWAYRYKNKLSLCSTTGWSQHLNNITNQISQATNRTAVRYEKDGKSLMITEATFSAGQLFIPLIDMNHEYYSGLIKLISTQGGKAIFELVNVLPRKDIEATNISQLNNVTIVNGNKINIPLIIVPEAGTRYSAQLKMLTVNEKISFELIMAQPLN